MLKLCPSDKNLTIKSTTTLPSCQTATFLSPITFQFFSSFPIKLPTSFSSFFPLLHVGLYINKPTPNFYHTFKLSFLLSLTLSLKNSNTLFSSSFCEEWLEPKPLPPILQITPLQLRVLIHHHQTPLPLMILINLH